MLYRESGDFSETYKADSQTFPIKFDRYRYYAVLIVAFLVIPLVINDYWANAVLVPFLIYAIAAIGLNILVGYCGQVSLGTGGFMAVGAYACYKLMTAFPEVSIMIHVVISGGIAAAVVTVFGLPSLRIKGFYLAVATLAAQFFLVWLFNRVAWFYNYSSTGQITAPDRTVLGYLVTGPNTEAWSKYLICLVFLTISLGFSSVLFSAIVKFSTLKVRKKLVKRFLNSKSLKISVTFSLSGCSNIKSSASKVTGTSSIIVASCLESKPSSPFASIFSFILPLAHGY